MWLREEDQSPFEKPGCPPSGICDCFAIDWGYRYFPDRTGEEWNEWVRQELRDSSKRFEAGLDARAQSEDLGNDHVEFNSLGNREFKAIDGHG